MVTEETFIKELALQINIARESFGKTQNAVLVETGIHVGRIEMGDASIRLFTYYRLCKHFKIDFNDLLKEIERKLDPTTPA
jgi:transcriptional regulator with XRE-family HTH domain